MTLSPDALLVMFCSTVDWGSYSDGAGGDTLFICTKLVWMCEIRAIRELDFDSVVNNGSSIDFSFVR